MENELQNQPCGSNSITPPWLYCPVTAWPVVTDLLCLHFVPCVHAKQGTFKKLPHKKKKTKKRYLFQNKLQYFSTVIFL